TVKGKSSTLGGGRGGGVHQGGERAEQGGSHGVGVLFDAGADAGDGVGELLADGQAAQDVEQHAGGLGGAVVLGQRVVDERLPQPERVLVERRQRGDSVLGR